MEKKIEINKSKTPPKASSAGFSTSKKQLDKIEINPKVPSEVAEQAGNAVVLTFGRFNPPTVGHQKLVEAVKKIAASKRAKPLVYLSHSQDSKKNPLSYKDKMKYAREAFGDLMHVSKAKTIIEVLKELENTYKNITVVVGSDRVNEFSSLLNKYNGKEYNFDSIVVESAGERDPDAEGVAGMSASKMRQAVRENDIKAFKSGLPSKLKSVATEIFNVLKVEMHIREEMENELEAEGLLNEAVLNLQQRIKRKILMRKYKTKILRAKQLAQRRLAGTPKLKARAQRMARDVARKRFAGQRGVKYHELSPSDKIAVDRTIDKKGALIKRIASRLLPTVRKKEVQRLRSFNLGQAMKAQPIKPVKEENDIMEMVSFKEMSQQVKRRGRPAKPETLAKRAAAAKVKAKEDGEEDYGPDNGREADQNLIIQLQKSISMHGKKDVTFDQGPAVMIKPDQARKALDHYFGLKKPADKLAFIKNASANYTNFKKMIGEEKDDTDELLTIIENVMDRIEMTEISEEAVDGLKKKAEKSGVSLGILKQVFKRGMGAYKSSHRPGTTPQQWAFARVNSFLSGGKTRTTADADLWAKVKKEGLNEAGLWANIHAKRERIKNGSGERMRKPGSKGAPTKDALKSAQEAFKMPKETAAEKAYRRHQELRKKSGLPDPEEYKKRIAQKQKEIDALRKEEVEINEDAASHLRAAAAMAKAGKHVAAAIHKKIAGALQRGDSTTAQGFKRQLQNARAKTTNESLGGFEHHPEVRKIMSFKEMKAAPKMTSTTVRSSKQMENDPEDQIFVGSYRSKHFETSPEAQKLYMNLPKGTDPNMASMAAQEQDNLFGIWKKVQVSKFATPEDVAAAKLAAMKVMKFAGDMNLNSEHGYVVDIYRKIVDAQSGNTERPPSAHLADDPRFQTLPKNLNQEPGPGNDKDVDNLSNYLISRNIKAQRKLKIIDND